MMGRAGATVLVVDDDPAVRGLLASSLDVFGFPVYTAPNVAMALTLLTDGAPEPPIGLILLDLFLPRGSGLTLLDAMAERGIMMPVIAMSGYPELLAAAEAAGAVHTFSKPFDLHDLVAIIERYCPRNRPV